MRDICFWFQCSFVAQPSQVSKSSSSNKERMPSFWLLCPLIYFHRFKNYKYCTKKMNCSLKKTQTVGSTKSKPFSHLFYPHFPRVSTDNSRHVPFLPFSYAQTCVHVDVYMWMSVSLEMGSYYTDDYTA